MKISRFLVLLMLCFTHGVFADDEKYKICFINGYFSGADDRFLSGLATHIQSKMGLINDSLCMAAHRAAYDVGAHFSKYGKVENDSDYKIIKYASEFSAKAYEAVGANIKP